MQQCLNAHLTPDKKAEVRQLKPILSTCRTFWAEVNGCEYLFLTHVNKQKQRLKVYLKEAI